LKASLDTNVIIHLYRAGYQEILFRFFTEGVFIYEQIRNIELENHGQDVLKKVSKDIDCGRIKLYTDEELKNLGVLKLFQGYARENRLLYGSGDLGEVYAISLAQTLGAYALVTDDIKQGGPYMSLLQFPDNEIMPFTYADVIFLRYLAGDMDGPESVKCFFEINQSSNLNWSLKSQLAKFVRRFWLDPYQESERKWMTDFCEGRQVNWKEKIQELRKLL